MKPIVFVSFLFAVAIGSPAGRASAPAGRYTTTYGTVFDTYTKLTWQRAVDGTASGRYSALNADTYCAALALNGTGWRLPTIKELQTLVDYSVANGSPMIDGTAFPGTPADAFWSSTHFDSAQFRWFLNFATGANSEKSSGGNNGVSSAYFVRCVR